LKRVIVSVTNDLVADQRVHKVSLSLMNMGFDVLLVGRKFRNSHPVEREYNTKRFRLLFNKGLLFYAEYNFRLFLFLLFAKADIFLSNDLDSLTANYMASKIRGKKLVYDSHEYFTEVPELIGRSSRKVWLYIEKKILPKVKFSYTVCQSIADIYNEKYGMSMKVVRNVPKTKQHEVIENKRERIIIYQGALNVGRGIENVIKAMKFIDNAKFLIIGGGDIENDLRELAKVENVERKVEFTGKLPFEKLHNYTKRASVGISLEEDRGLNYRYALPNKIFDYIHAGVPILSSSLPEIKRVVQKYDVGLSITDFTPENIATDLEYMLSSEDKRIDWALNLKIAAKELCWEKEEFILKGIYAPVTH
jgi:glycosyltransferase involved in cell wall biosynthesis